jgi:hypothetical protein
MGVRIPVLNGTQSKDLLGEIPEANNTANGLASPAQRMSAALRAALDELEKEVRMFLQSAQGQNAHHPDG